MPNQPPELGLALTTLRKEYPDAGALGFAGAFEIILYENIACLVPEPRREQVWDDFCARIGTTAEDIVGANPDLLEEVLRPGGMHPTRRADKIRTCCDLVLEEFDNDLDGVLKWPEKPRRMALKKFPGFGDPGVDKILLLTKTERILALESNGLRVLLRLGFGEEAKSYSTTYRNVQAAIADELPKRIDAVIQAHIRLRDHGRLICKHNAPRCGECCLRKICPSSS